MNIKGKTYFAGCFNIPLLRKYRTINGVAPNVILIRIGANIL